MKQKTLYFCDPMMNRECTKENCFIKGGTCQCTSNIFFAMLNIYGIPVLCDGEAYSEEHENEDQLDSKIQE